MVVKNTRNKSRKRSKHSKLRTEFIGKYFRQVSQNLARRLDIIYSIFITKTMI